MKLQVLERKNYLLLIIYMHLMGALQLADVIRFLKDLVVEVDKKQG